MIAERSTTTRIDGTMTGEKIVMGFDPNSLTHLQSIYINMYSDTELAIIREYSVNGRDACIEAGIDRPIEVSLPGALSPYLKVRDFGVGLSVDDIRTIYSQYGASTKRGTNDQTGQLGIGSKSGLAYQPQFTVVSIKDGMRTQVVVSLDEHGAGQMTVVEPGPIPTVEPSGTEVIIPAKQVNSLASKARHFFSFWEKGTVLLDGEEPEGIEGIELLDKPVSRTKQIGSEGRSHTFTIQRMVLNSNQRQSYVVMGGVPYPVGQDDLKCGLGYTTSLTVFVAIGDVFFAPTREALNMTSERVKQCLTSISEAFKDEAPRAMQRAIDSTGSPSEALQMMLKWNGILPSSARGSEYRYKGRKLPQRFEIGTRPMTDFNGKPVLDENGKVRTVGLPITVLDREPRRLNTSGIANYVSAENINTGLWVYGFDPEKDNWTSGKRKKLNLWCEQNKVNTYVRYGDLGTGTIQAERFYLVKDKPTSPFIDPKRIVPFGPIEDTKLPRTVGARAGQSGRIPGSYDMIVAGVRQYGIPADDIDTSEPVYYLNTTDYGPGHASIPLVCHYEPDATIVLMICTRIEKFKRFFPDTKSVVAVAREYRDEWIETLPDATKEAIAWHDATDVDDFVQLGGYEIKDPEIKAACDMTKKDLTAVLKERNLFRNFGIPIFTTEWENPLHKYPLIGRYVSFKAGSPETDHYVTYMNAAYEAHFKPEAQQDDQPKTTGDNA